MPLSLLVSWRMMCLQALLDAPLRFIKLDVLRSWPQLKVYEEIDAARECLEKPYVDVSEQDWAQLLVLSYRWSAAKPAQLTPGFSPMSPAQYAELQALTEHAQAHGLRYMWVDYSCGPQYAAASGAAAAGGLDPTMVEILRSKVGICP